LDASEAGALGVRIAVRHVLSRRQVDEPLVDLDGTTVPATAVEASGDALLEVTAWLGRPARGSVVEVGLTTPAETASTYFPARRDDRVLGLAVSEIELLSRPG
jgi:hypothetical protein